MSLVFYSSILSRIIWLYTEVNTDLTLPTTKYENFTPIIQLPFLFFRVTSDKVYKNEDNIGTVLFEKSDCGKHCWSSEEFAIINSRRMFQDILPKVIKIFVKQCWEKIFNLAFVKVSNAFISIYSLRHLTFIGERNKLSKWSVHSFTHGLFSHMPGVRS